jgi:hypothetical protein
MSTAVEGDFLCGAGEICAYVNTLFSGRQFTDKQIYRLIETGRVPAGKHGERVLIASKSAIRAALTKAAGAANPG